MEHKLLGVLGGMGPLATVDFLQKLIEETPATHDQEHVPVIAYSVPQMPDRPPAITGNGESPLPYMIKGVHTLKRAGASAVAIACNTAHYWYDDLLREGGLPILHIADAACALLKGQRVGLLATTGTLQAGFYQQRLAARGLDCLLSTVEEQQTLVNPAIEHVKRNALPAAHTLATRAAMALLERGAQGVILGCTEIPLAIEHASSDASPWCIDATRALARQCVAWWQSSADGAMR